MTIRDLHNSFDIELDKTLDFEYPYILPEQKDYWLNKAQDRFIEERLYPINPQKKGFEGNQKRIDELKPLVSPTPLSITPSVVGTTYISQLPNDYLHLIRHRCITNDSTCGAKTVSGREVQQDDINILLIDPHQRPNADEPLYYLAGNSIIYEQIVGFTITSTLLNYIIKPNKMRLGTDYTSVTTDVECDFQDEYVQHKILDIAISMILENIESQRYQTNLNELNKTD